MTANASPSPLKHPSKLQNTPVQLALDGTGYYPTWTAAFEGYAANFIRKNHWKIERTHDRDDAWQEVHFVFYDCVRRYADRCENAAHFMSLFKLMLSTHFVDLAAVSTKVRTEISASDDGEGDVSDYTAASVGELRNAGEALTLLRQAPREVRTVLALFLNAPPELLQMALDSARGSSHRATINRCLGLPADFDCVSVVTDYFTKEH